MTPETIRILTDEFARLGITLDVEAIRCRSHKPEIVFVRRLAAIELRKLGYPYQTIGKMIGRTHASVHKLVTNPDSDSYKQKMIERINKG